MTDLVLRSAVDEIVVLTLNAPQQRNAISVEMREELLALLRAATVDPDCKAIVVTGADGQFSSGGAISGGGGSGPNPLQTRVNLTLFHEIVRILATGAKPTVAAVHGYCYGAGLGLATSCDYLVADDTAKFCASFGKVGLGPDAGTVWSLAQRCGPSVSRDLLLSNRVVKADEAKAIGLANRAVAAGQAIEQAIVAARELTSTAPLSAAAIKGMLARGWPSLEDVLSAEAETQPMLTLTQDYAEGKLAFRERRAPAFRGL